MPLIQRFVDWSKELIDRIRTWWSKLWKQEDSLLPVLPPSSSITDSVEIFALHGHGRTSFIWATLFMLRQLSRAWPRYLCWPLDQTTSQALVRIHEELRSGRLPERWKAVQTVEEEPDGGEEDSPDAEEGPTADRYSLHMRNMKPWGERYFVVSDRPDPAFRPRQFELLNEPTDIRWNRPAIWLLSLSDLDEVQGRSLDLLLDDLVRVRHDSGEAAREAPFRLIVVLTKGDAVADLPSELRGWLKEDQLTEALAIQAGEVFRANDEVRLGPVPRPSSDQVRDDYPDRDPIDRYFSARGRIDELIREWLSTNAAGRSLIRRAEELKIDLRFSLVSATGTGMSDGRQLATAWSPRRVLDPYFWALEMGA